MRVREHERLLIGSLAVVLLGLIAESAYMFHYDRLVEEEAERWAANTQARVQHTQAIRKEILDLSLCPSTSADAAACMLRARDRIDGELIEFEKMRPFPGRAEALGQMRRELGVLDGGLTELQEVRGRRSQYDVAVMNVIRALEPLNTAVDQLAEAGVHQTLRRTSQVGTVVRRSEISELVIAVTAFLIAAFATLLGVRSMRRSQCVLSAKADELELFAGTVAHDLLSPLASLGINMPVIQERYPDDEQTQRLTARALSNVRRVRALVDELLGFARSGAKPSGARAAAAQVVTEVVNELSEQAAAAGAEVSIEEMTDASVACSAGVLYSIVSNLVTNALKYLGDATVRNVRIRGRTSGTHVRFEVEDTGPGVAPSLARKIFEPYVRAGRSGQPGFGLGLATVKRLVCAHGGNVGLRDGSRGGAIFWFELPRSGAAADGREAPRASA